MIVFLVRLLKQVIASVKRWDFQYQPNATKQVTQKAKID